MKTKLITISGCSGGGKTTVSEALKKRLNTEAIISFDSYDEIIDFPDNYPSSKPNEYSLSKLADMVKQIKERENLYVIFDYPFGRANSEINSLIDYAVYIKAPLDIAMARRVRRDLLNTAECQLERTLWELDMYDKGGRDFIINWESIVKSSCDFVADGLKPVETIVNDIVREFKLSTSSWGSINL